MSIWKDPNKEMPTPNSRCIIIDKYLETEVHVCEFLAEYRYPHFSAFGGNYYQEDVEKWCYEEDLIKQAEGESDE